MNINDFLLAGTMTTKNKQVGGLIMNSPERSRLNVYDRELKILYYYRMFMTKCTSESLKAKSCKHLQDLFNFIIQTHQIGFSLRF